MGGEPKEGVVLRLSGGGERFLERYFQTIDQIVLNPWSVPVKFGDYHRALISKTSLAIYYFEHNEKTVVVCVIDVRRHPAGHIHLDVRREIPVNGRSGPADGQFREHHLLWQSLT